MSWLVIVWLAQYHRSAFQSVTVLVASLAVLARLSGSAAKIDTTLLKVTSGGHVENTSSLFCRSFSLWWPFCTHPNEHVSSCFSSAAGRVVPESVAVATFVKCKHNIIVTVMITRRCVSARKTTNSLSRVQQIRWPDWAPTGVDLWPHCTGTPVQDLCRKPPNSSETFRTLAATWFKCHQHFAKHLDRKIWINKAFVPRGGSHICALANILLPNSIIQPQRMYVHSYTVHVCLELVPKAHKATWKAPKIFFYGSEWCIFRRRMEPK